MPPPAILLIRRGHRREADRAQLPARLAARPAQDPIAVPPRPERQAHDGVKPAAALQADPLLITSDYRAEENRSGLHFVLALVERERG